MFMKLHYCANKYRCVTYEPLNYTANIADTGKLNVFSISISITQQQHIRKKYFVKRYTIKKV